MDDARARAVHGWTAALTWKTFLCVGIVLTLSVILVPGWPGEVLWDVIPVLAVAATVVGIRRNRPAAARSWWLLAASMTWWCLSDVAWTTWYVITGDDSLIPWWFDLFYLPTYALLTAGLGGLPRNPQRSRNENATTDAFIVAMGLALLYWVLVFRTHVGTDALADPSRVVSIVSIGLGLSVVFVTARLAFRYGTTNRAYLMLATGVVASTLGDMLYTVTLTGDGLPGISLLDTSLVEGLGSASWLVWFVLFASAALHPSSSGTCTSGTTTAHTATRGAIFVVMATIGPITYLLTFEPGSIVSMRWSDLAVPLLTLTVMSAFLVGRLVAGTSTAQRRAVQLDRQAAELSQALREQSNLQKLLRKQALRDPLTGLGNRAHLSARLADPGPPGGRTLPRAVLMVDLDGFKGINDNYGHPAGDQLLTAVARRLRRIVVPTDTLARLGGDEFAIVLERATDEDAHDTAWRIVRALAEPLEIDGQSIRVAASVGVRVMDDTVSVQQGLRDADLALYAAKAAGKNQAYVFTPRLRIEQAGRSSLTEGLRHAVARDELEVRYQPVVDLDSGEMLAVEALLRWHPVGGLVMPDRFIPVAEDTGLIIPIGAHVLQRACADARPWYERHGVAVHVNISGHQLRRPDVVDTVLEALHASGLPGEALVLEITETALLATGRDEAAPAIAHLATLREHGIRAAIDDFGTGYSSLSYLRDLPVDIVKIDGAFTRIAAETGEDARRRRALAGAIVDLCASLDLTAVAEQVETQEEAEALRALGCPQGQGYLFGRPVPREEIDGLLDSATVASSVLRGTGGPRQHEHA